MKKKNDVKVRPVLKEGYYLNNFQTLLDYVLKNYNKLLKEEEHNFIREFKKLSVGSRRLYVRLIMRKGPYFREDKIDYPEIKDIRFSLNELCKKSFLKHNPRKNIEFALNKITNPELEKIIKDNKGVFGKSSQKLKNKEDITALFLDQDEIKLWNLLEKSYSFYSPDFYELIITFKLLFFGNIYQNLSEFILEDIGVLKFEKYEIRDKDRFFSDRIIVDELLLISRLREDLYQAVKLNSVISVLIIGDYLKNTVSHPKIADKISKSFYEIGRFLERFNMWDGALDYYKLADSSLSNERKIRILDKKGMFNEALEECQKVTHDSNEELIEFSQRFSETMKRKLGLPYNKKTKETFIKEELILEQNFYQKVEEISLNYYKSVGYNGFYTENGIWKALFSLTFWDIIFMPVPEVFFNPFHRGPIDLFSTDFRTKRNKEIERQLLKIKQKSWSKTILQLYDKKHGTACHLMSWKTVKKEQLEILLNIVPAKDIVCILDRMSYNLKDLKTGFPDLFIFDFKKHKYVLTEIKGPGDQLQPNQKRWIRYFEKHNIPYKIAEVKWK